MLAPDELDFLRNERRRQFRQYYYAWHQAKAVALAATPPTVFFDPPKWQKNVAGTRLVK